MIPDIYRRAQYEKKPSGTILMDGKEVGHTMQCKHCGNHYLSIRGSGRRRGFCMFCFGVTCGRAQCDPCIPFEAKLEIVEGKRNVWKSAADKLVEKFHVPLIF